MARREDGDRLRATVDPVIAIEPLEMGSHGSGSYG